MSPWLENRCPTCYAPQSELQVAVFAVADAHGMEHPVVDHHPGHLPRTVAKSIADAHIGHAQCDAETFALEAAIELDSIPDPRPSLVALLRRAIRQPVKPA